jgi:hypothetical protein
MLDRRADREVHANEQERRSQHSQLDDGGHSGSLSMGHRVLGPQHRLLCFGANSNCATSDTLRTLDHGRLVDISVSSENLKCSHIVLFEAWT